MFRTRRDVPLDRDAAGRFLPWIIAFMVYLAVLATAAALTVSSLTSAWDNEVAGTMTVQVPPRAARQAAPAGAAGADAGLQAVLEVLRKTPGVASAVPLGPVDIERLLGPWLGPGGASADLPLPRLVDIVLDPSAPLDRPGLSKRLAEIAPGATIEDHRVWLRDLLVFARSVEVLSVAIVLLVAAVGIATVVYATRAGFAIHRGTVELLHMIGAQDAYIAAQFQWHAFRLGARGALVGITFAGATLGLLAHLAGQVESALLPRMGMGIGELLVLAVVPIGATLVTMYTARLAVVRSLAEMV
ncbi:MAG: cell division protein [Alphaproteobacteria bacterium]|nr:cell division protein [Alphaproteobacteria bacterium]